MILYTIKLTKSEVEELKSIISKGSHTSQTFRVAYILLNCDEGKYSDKVSNEQISKVLNVYSGVGNPTIPQHGNPTFSQRFFIWLAF